MFKEDEFYKIITALCIGNSPWDYMFICINSLLLQSISAHLHVFDLISLCYSRFQLKLNKKNSAIIISKLLSQRFERKSEKCKTYCYEML